VDDAQLVHVLHGRQQLHEDLARLPLPQLALALHVRAQVAAARVLHDDVDALGGVDHLQLANAVRMVEPLHELDLLRHALPVVGLLQLPLLVTLDSDLGTSKAVPREAHLAE
jgi:hypothetical protein